jgi:hypothetical protein
MIWPPNGHDIGEDAARRVRERQITFLRSEPDPDSPFDTREDMHRLFGGMPVVQEA